MKEQFGTSGEDVSAIIGPCISFESLEVGEEVYSAFEEKGFDMSVISMWKPEKKKHPIDLTAAIIKQLCAFGVFKKSIESADICTFIQQQEFFSARRLGINSGRLWSGIMLNN